MSIVFSCNSDNNNSVITNAQISGSAAISYSKLNLTNSIVVADIASAAKSTGATNNTLALRDSSGKLTASSFIGAFTSTSGVTRSLGAFNTATNNTSVNEVCVGSTSAATSFSMRYNDNSNNPYGALAFNQTEVLTVQSGAWNQNIATTYNNPVTFNSSVALGSSASLGDAIILANGSASSTNNAFFSDGGILTMYSTSGGPIGKQKYFPCRRAYVSGTDATVTNNYGISNGTHVATGKYSFTVTSSGLIPAVTATPVNAAGGNLNCVCTALSATSVAVWVYLAGALADNDFNLVLMG